MKAHIYNPNRGVNRNRRTASRPILAAAMLSLAASTVASTALSAPQRADVITHPSQGEVTVSNANGARLAWSGDSVFVALDAKDLAPNHAYTMWVVAINAPENCTSVPCSEEDVMEHAEVVKADIGYGSGAVAGSDGTASFAAFQPVGLMPHSWFGRGLTNTAAEIHLVIRDHGPLVRGQEAEMLGTFRAGCDAESVPETLPAAAQSDGQPGGYHCVDVQAAVFPVVE